jgi:hypothetical protein
MLRDFMVVRSDVCHRFAHMLGWFPFLHCQSDTPWLHTVIGVMHAAENSCAAGVMSLLREALAMIARGCGHRMSLVQRASRRPIVFSAPWHSVLQWELGFFNI